MTLPLIIPQAPATDGAANVQTSTSVRVRLGAAAPADIVESTIQMSVAGQQAVRTEYFPADGDVSAGSVVFRSAFGRAFTDADVGRTLFVVTAANPRNIGKAWITARLSTNQCTVERPALSGTATIVASTNVLNGSSTAFLSEVQPGDWLVLDSDYGSPLQVAAVLSNTVIHFVTASAVSHTGVQVNPTFHSVDTIMDWRLQSFGDSFNGTIKPFSGGGLNGYEIEAWPITRLTGTLTVPQPVTTTPTGTTLVGVGSTFRSELHQSTKVFLTGKRTHVDPIDVPTVASDTLINISAYPKANTPLIGYRDADLPGTPTSGSAVSVTVLGLDTLGQSVTVNPVPGPTLQPISTYAFSTSTRPRVMTADPMAASLFGLGVRVSFSENLLGYTAGLNEPIQNVRTYAVVPDDPAVPTPTITSVVLGPGDPSYVDLMFSSPMTNAQPYRVTVKGMGLRATSTNKLSGAPWDSVSFVGFGPASIADVMLDTTVATPQVTGPQQVDFQSPAQQFELLNLDPDVVAIQLGPQAAGVEIVGGSFTNNGDGTGTFEVSFSTLLTSFKVSIEAIDDVDNVSSESNVWGVLARPETVPGTALEIRPQYPVHKQTCDRLLAGIPSGPFYLRAGFVIPYFYDPTPFTLKVLERGQPISIAITRDIEGQTGTLYQSFIPQSLTETVMLQLGRGRNLVYVTDGTHHDFIIVSATTYATVLCSIASEIFDFSQVELDEVQNAVFSPVSSRLAEPYLPFPELLPTPSVRSQQTLATKLAIRSFVADPGSSRAVLDLTTAISLQTSIPVPIHNPKTYFQPAIERIYTSQEAFGGFKLHTWFHNECMNRWDAFIQFLANSPDRIQMLRASEDEVLFEDQMGTTRRHVFDFSNPLCSSLSSAINCFDGLSFKLLFFGDFTIPVCAAAYPFDSCFSNAHPLGSGRVTFDSEIPWDSDVPLDYDVLDPGDDGWVGFCWADRWDSGVVVDDFTNGSYAAGSAIFTDVSAPFAPTDVGRWVRVTSGTRQGSRKIKAVIDSQTVRLDFTSDITETSLTWSLVRDVHPLDSMGPAPAIPVDAFQLDGHTISGSDVFGTDGQYSFSAVDVGRNLIVLNSTVGIVSLVITGIVDDQHVNVGRPNGTGTTDHIFEFSEINLNWELWDTTPPVCVFDGYANKLVALHSNDLPLQVLHNVVTTLDGSAPTMNQYFVPTGNQTVVNQVGGIDAVVATIPVTTTAGFPGAGTLILDSEIITYAGTTPTSFTGCTRGTNGTPATAHINGTLVTGITITTISTPNVNGLGVMVGGGTVTAAAVMAGLFGPAVLGGSSSVGATGTIFREASAVLEADAYIEAIPTGGQDIDTAVATLRGYGWISGQPVLNLSAQATLLGQGSLTMQELPTTISGSATLTGSASVTAVGSVA